MVEATRFTEIKDVVSVSGFVQDTRLHVYFLVKFQTVITKIVLELKEFGRIFNLDNRLKSLITTEKIQTGLNSVEVTGIKCNFSEASEMVCLVDTKGTKIWVVNVTSSTASLQATRLFKPFDYDCSDMRFALNFYSVSCHTKVRAESGEV